jgi:hypothetical protein
MSTNYYFVNRKREELKKEFEKALEIATIKPEKDLLEFVEKNEERFGSLDVWDSIQKEFERLRTSLYFMISSQEIEICTRTFKGVKFKKYNGFDYDGLGSFFDMKSLRKFYEKNKEDWVLMNEYEEAFENFDDFINDLEIDKKSEVSWN